MSKPKQTARLWQWSRYDGRLMGQVYGHPGHEDGTEITTSTILSPPDSIKEGGQIETRNTIYTLGTEYKSNQENK